MTTNEQNHKDVMEKIRSFNGDRIMTNKTKFKEDIRVRNKREQILNQNPDISNKTKELERGLYMVKEELFKAELKGRQEARKETFEEVEKIINKYLKEKTKTIHTINEDWKEHKSYPMYSNMYYAYVDLKDFYEDLKQQLKSLEKKE
jgi:hypothetical protein